MLLEAVVVELLVGQRRAVYYEVAAAVLPRSCEKGEAAAAQYSFDLERAAERRILVLGVLHLRPKESLVVEAEVEGHWPQAKA